MTTGHTTGHGKGHWEYTTFAHTLADAAGAVLRARFRQAPAAQTKPDGSPVTEADRAAEAAMRALIAEHYPAHGIFGEEAGRERETAALQWVLDPIDGTRAFMAGYPLFTTLIALCENGVPVLGVIDQPHLRERWSAQGGATLLNGAPVAASARKTLAGAAIATTSTPYFTPAQAQAFASLIPHVTLVHGGDAYAYAMLASGQLHAVVDAGMKPYDFCCLPPLIHGAGGVITDWHGAPLTLASEGHTVAACTPELHAEILAVLKG